MFLKSAALLFAAQALASPLESLNARQSGSCPKIHIFGARETTAPQGYGTAGTVVNLILGAHSGATAEAIVHPACGGQSACGGVSYANSAQQGTDAVAKAVNAFNAKCPSTELVLVGYSQAKSWIMPSGDDSKTTPISDAAMKMVKAAIFMGDPRHIAGLPYNVGTCQASGFAPRPKGFVCPNANLIQSYCDSADPYCCNGNDANAHQQYGNKYGQAALKFVNSKL